MFIKATSSNEFHRVINATVWQCANIVHRNDAGMFELREDARFARESGGELAIRIQRVENLKCNAARKLFVFGGVYGSHAPACYEFAQPVARTRKIRGFGAIEAAESLIAQKCHFVDMPKSVL